MYGGGPKEKKNNVAFSYITSTLCDGSAECNLLFIIHNLRSGIFEYFKPLEQQNSFQKGWLDTTCVLSY